MIDLAESIFDRGKWCGKAGCRDAAKRMSSQGRAPVHYFNGQPPRGSRGLIYTPPAPWWTSEAAFWVVGDLWLMIPPHGKQ